MVELSLFYDIGRAVIGHFDMSNCLRSSTRGFVYCVC